MKSLNSIMQSPRDRHRQRRLKRFNEWLQQGHDGLYARHMVLDATEDENSPPVRFEG